MNCEPTNHTEASGADDALQNNGLFFVPNESAELMRALKWRKNWPKVETITTNLNNVC